MATAQQAQQKPAPEAVARSAEKADKAEKPAHPAQLELLETTVRFETNGDSRKEVHALVKINSELGVRQFAQLNLDFNRSFETVEIPMLHITHPSGGTADILPSAVTDHPNPAVVNFAAYQDVRVKSVRILGLQPGDTLEYRLVRTVSHHPLAPDFWLEHRFDRTGVVMKEIFELDLPASRQVQMRINSETPASETPADVSQKTGRGAEGRAVYRWERNNPGKSTRAADDHTGKPEGNADDIALSTFPDWQHLSLALAATLTPGAVPLDKLKTPEDQIKELKEKPEIEPEVAAKARELTRSAKTDAGRAEAIYDFVSQKIRTVNLPLGATGFAPRSAKEIVSSGYATPEDKFVIFASLEKAVRGAAYPAFTGTCDKTNPPLPSLFSHLDVLLATPDHPRYWLDPSLEVAPFGMISRGSEKCALVASKDFYFTKFKGNSWMQVADRLPFAAEQRVNVDASLTRDGKLSAKIHYSMRGDNELVLRVAFHHTPKERWNEVAQLLSITDGFRGQVSTVEASDPYATKEPFAVEYELEQPKFVDWSKKTVRIPALLPQFGLPDPPAKPASGLATTPIELGTPLEVETKMTLHLPPGTSASAPAGTSVERDYATFTSQYSVNGSTLTATRRIKFVLREVPAARAADYNAFLRAVQNDESQNFTLEMPNSPAPKTDSAAPHETAPPKPVAPKP